MNFLKTTPKSLTAPVSLTAVGLPDSDGTSTPLGIKKPRTLSEVFTLPLTYLPTILLLLLRCGQSTLVVDYRSHHSYTL